MLYLIRQKILMKQKVTNMKKKTGFGSFYGKYLERQVPAYGVLSLISCFLVNCLIYWGTQLLAADAYHYDFTTELDRQIPFVKEWILIYVVCYLFWAANYILISREGKEKWFRFATADMMSRVICGVFFILLPTTNIRPEVAGTDFCSWLVRLIYSVDAPTNLFPSIHCLVSWFCFIGIRGSRKVPKWYQAFSCIFALLVCASTQFTKQHYLVDIAGGLLIAELCWFISNHTGLYRKTQQFFDWTGRKIFGVAYYDE